MGALMRDRDWSRSPLGNPEQWTSSLKTTVGLLLRAEAQIVLFWGPEFVALYNDAYAPTIGDKHRIRQLRPDLPIIFASGYSETAAIRSVTSDRSRVLHKPFKVHELQAALGELLARHGQ